MIKSRGTYFILIFFTIIIGLLSREFKVVPLFAGDILWALMVYFLVRFLLIDKPISIVIITSLLFCYFIEFSQLYKAPWIDSLRHTVFGGLVLGETFLWGDILSYTIGIGIGGLVDSWILKLKS